MSQVEEVDGGGNLDGVENGGNLENQFFQEQAVVNPRAQRRRRGKKRSRNEKLLWHVWEEENERFIDENLSSTFDLDNQNEVMVETAEAPPDLVIDLLRYQKEWLAWALKQENSEIRGGILADEMGMGKTIQAIALVLAKRELRRTNSEPSGSSSQSPGSPAGLPKINGTLVICPLVAVSQWVGEIDLYTSKGSTKVLVYHGPNREKSSKQLSKYDFVITTYSTIEADYRKYIMPPKTRCPYCGKSYNEKKLSSHLKYYCGPEAVKTEKQSKQQKKISISVPSKSKHKVEFGKDTISKPYEVEQHKEDHVPRKESVLHSVMWDRIILDEVSWNYSG